MLSFTRLADARDAPILSKLTLSFEQRVKSRQRVELDNGESAGLFLPRGTVLQHGDCLLADSGEVVQVQAAAETVSTVRVNDALQMARACYHLGNRHVPLQIAAGFIRYQHDHVLDDMIRGMGLTVSVEQAAFEPESGAYGEHAHGAHSHSHSHAH